MTCEIICGAAGSGKSEAVLEQYVRAIAEGGEDAALLLLPTRLACAHAREKLVTDRRLPGLLDQRILTFPDLADLILHANRAQAAAISGLQRRMLMRAVIDEVRAEGRLPSLAPVSDLPGLVDSLCELVEEIKRTALRPEQFAERLRRSGSDDGRGAELARVYARYQQRLVERDLYDDAGRFWQARDELKAGHRRPFEALRLILVDGFDDFTTTQLQVLRELISGGDCRLVITLCLEANDARRPELFTRTRRTMKRLEEELGAAEVRWHSGKAAGPLAAMGERLFAEGESDEVAPGVERVRLIEATGRRMEVRQVLGRVKDLLLEGVAPERMTLMARDLGGYCRPLLEVARELGVPLRLRGEVPVGARPSVQAILDVVRVPAGLLRADEVMRLLKSSHFDRAILGDEELEPDEIERVCAAAKIIGGRDAEDPVRHWRERLQTCRARLQREERARRDGGPDDERQWFHGSDEELAAELELVERVEEALTRLFGAFAPLYAADDLPALVEALAGVMKRLGTSAAVAGGDDPAAGSANIAAAGKLLEALRELHAMPEQLGTAPRLSLQEFRDELVRLARTTSFAPAGAAGGVTALGVDQARQLQFDHVFVLGMAEREFPRAAQEDALLGDDRRRELAAAGIALDPRGDSVYDDQLLFYRIAAVAQESLTLSYPRTNAEGQEVLHSWYVDEVRRCFGGAPEPERFGLAETIPGFAQVAGGREMLERALFEAYGADPLLDARDVDGAQRALTIAAAADGALLDALRGMIEVEDRRSGFDAPDEYDARLTDRAAVAEVARLFGPGRYLSPSALSNYARCPFAFFAERVLGLNVLEEPTEDVEAMQLGSIVHRCLSAFFDGWKAEREDCRLAEGDLKRARALMDEMVTWAFEDEVRAGTVGDEAVFAVARENVRRDLALWLEHEVGSVQSEGHTAWRWEQSFGFGRLAPVVIGEGEGQVLLRGRVDRIDLLEPVGGAPAFAVYDYKTGSIPAKARMGDGGDLQLPVYALAARQIVDQPNAVCADWGYYGAKRPIALKNRPGKKTPVEEIEGYIASASEFVKAYAAAIRAGCFTPQSPGRCTGSCDFACICRWDDYRFARKEGGEEHE
ncbi:MAG: hypothetical protein GX131_03350 [candidate division WS1 bacterium]|nr:hypothetical protein [candidate division WS1 bacterium]